MINPIGIYIKGLPITHKIQKQENTLVNNKTCKNIWNNNTPVYVKVFTTYDTCTIKIPKTHSEMIRANQSFIANLMNETNGSAIVAFDGTVNIDSIMNHDSNLYISDSKVTLHKIYL